MAYENFDEMDGLERSALLLNVLGNEITSDVFKQLKDNDIKRLVNAMRKMVRAPVSTVNRVLEEFYAEISEVDTLIFGHAQGRDFILSTVGEQRAKIVLGQLSIMEGSRTLEALELVDPRTLSNFLVNEHPQTVALILAHLETQKKCEVLKRLPEELQSEVILRISNLDFISPSLVAQVDEVLKQELATLGSVDTKPLGGVQPIAEMLNVMDKISEQSIMSNVEKKAPQLAEEIKKLMFVFDDLIHIDDRGIQLLMREVPNDKLVIALKSATEELREKFFKNISKRAAELLKEDLEVLTAIRLSDIESAQQLIVGIAKKLESEGKIVINRDGNTII